MSVYSYDKLYASKIGNALQFLLFFLVMTIVVLRAKDLPRSVGLLFCKLKRQTMTQGVKSNKTNPRYKNGTLRRKHRARLKAMGLPCAICGGPIHYDEPSDAKHPLSFVVDEKIPVSKYWLGGYESKEQCAQDWNNLQAVHYCCNASKGAKLNYKKVSATVKNTIDGDW